MTNILVDTDVLLDFFLDRKPFSEHSAQILSLCETNIIKGYLSPVILSNLYYLLRKTAGHQKVIEKLSLLASIMDVVVIDKHVVLEALNSRFSDFEDALQNYSAEQHKGIDVIITRNTRDFANSALSVLTPEQFIKLREVGI